MDMLIRDKIKAIDYWPNATGWSIDYDKFMALPKLLRNKIWSRLDRGPLTSRRLEIVNESLDNKTSRDLKKGWHIWHCPNGRIWMAKV